jgi:hypothetical protein
MLEKFTAQKPLLRVFLKITRLRNTLGDFPSWKTFTRYCLDYQTYYCLHLKINQSFSNNCTFFGYHTLNAWWTTDLAILEYDNTWILILFFQFFKFHISVFDQQTRNTNIFAVYHTCSMMCTINGWFLYFIYTNE